MSIQSNGTPERVDNAGSPLRFWIVYSMVVVLALSALIYFVLICLIEAEKSHWLTVGVLVAGWWTFGMLLDAWRWQSLSYFRHQPGETNSAYWEDFFSEAKCVVLEGLVWPVDVLRDPCQYARAYLNEGTDDV